MYKLKLPRLKQCEKCPWKVDVDPFEIPDGYSVDRHCSLDKTIAKDLSYEGTTQQVMACHHSNGNDNMYCIGYLHNQLGIGNNIRLRLRMLDYDNVQHIKIVGDQHKSFEDTLPKQIKNEKL